MKLINDLIQLTPKEFECLTNMFDRLKGHGWKPSADEVELILTKNKDSRRFTNKEINIFMEWRRPKGTPRASPCYMRILNAYFKLRICKTCNRSGHDVDDNVCPVCHGSGRDPEFPM